MADEPERVVTTGYGIGTFALPCPASIWLLGAPANCRKSAGHEGMHEVNIQWTVT
jgi:hypothetical protein